MTDHFTISFIRSRTVQWCIIGGIAYAMKHATNAWGLPMLPADIQSEAVTLVQGALEAVVPLAFAMAARFRVLATRVIDRVM